jgi:ribonuclease BN (tRNA processing enzyme)
MFDRTFAVSEYDAETPFTAAGLQVVPVRLPHYTLETYGFRVSNDTTTLAYTGDTGPSERIADLARDVDLLVCEATLETGAADGEPRGHLSVDEALDAYRASGARRLLLTHRPSELALPAGLDLAYDGMEVEIEPAG